MNYRIYLHKYVKRLSFTAKINLFLLDTIRLRLYGTLDTDDSTLSLIQRENGLSNHVVPEHHELYVRILKHRGKNFHLKVQYNREKEAWEDVSEGDFITKENSLTYSHHKQNRQMIRFIDEGKVKDINMKINGSYRVPSSFSDVAFTVNENGSFIDFEFSIPKYIYGHSLAEFIPQQGSDLRYHEVNNLFNFSTQKKYLHKRLNNFIDTFFSDLCGHFGVDMLPNKKYIEIRRLDICYNQYFKSKSDALGYLDEQRKLHLKRRKRQKHASETNNYTTTLAFTASNGSYFKIYHKGTEYSKTDGDLRKHIELNKAFIDSLNLKEKYQKIYDEHQKEIWALFLAKGKDEVFVLKDKTKEDIREVVRKIYERIPYKVDFLKEQMDLVLRYEISLKTDFFSNMYKSKIFRTGSEKYKVKGCPHHKRAKERWRAYQSSLDSRIKNKKKVSPRDRETWKMYNAWRNKSVSMILGRSEIMRRFETKAGMDYNKDLDHYAISRFEYQHTILGGKDVGYFSDRMLQMCVDHFAEKVDFYQISHIRPYDEIITKIKEYNEQALINVERYNATHHYMTLDAFGKPLRKKNGAKITKATQLLKQKELRDWQLKTVNVTLMATFLHHINLGKSLDQVFDEMNTPSSTKSRIRQDLKMFGVFDQSLNMIVDVSVATDYKQYYWNTDSEIYRSKFYVEQKHFNYGQYKVERKSTKRLKAS